MVVVMAADATEADADNVVSVVEEAGGAAFVSRGVTRTIVGVVGDDDRFETLNLARCPASATWSGSPRRTSWSAGRTTRSAR